MSSHPTVPTVPTVPGPFNTIDEVHAVVAPMMAAIAAAAGPSCEVVLHDLTHGDLERSVHSIINGHVTGRGVGGPSTNLGLEVMHDQGSDHDAFGYSGRTADGRDLRCSSVYYRNANGRIIAALCINVDLTPLQTARSILDGLLPAASTTTPPREHHRGSVSTLLDTMIDEEIAAIGKPAAVLDRHERTRVLAALEARGAFELKRAMDTTAKRLGISKVTAYAYLDRHRSAEPGATP